MSARYGSLAGTSRMSDTTSVFCLPDPPRTLLRITPNSGMDGVGRRDGLEKWRDAPVVADLPPWLWDDSIRTHARTEPSGGPNTWSDAWPFRDAS